MVAGDINRNVSGINDSALEINPRPRPSWPGRARLLAGLSCSLDERLACSVLGRPLRGLSPGRAPRPSPSRRTDQVPAPLDHPDPVPFPAGPRRQGFFFINENVKLPSHLFQ